MLKNKILGIFLCLDYESFTTNYICELTNSDSKEVKPIIEELIKEGKITGKRKYKLKK